VIYENENENGNNNNYINFPLIFLELIWQNPKIIEKIFSYGIVYFDLKNYEYEINEVARQTADCFYRNQKGMFTELLRIYNKYVNADKITNNEDNSGFDGNEFNPVNEIIEILEIFESDNIFMELSILNYKINQKVKLFIEPFPIDVIYKEYLELKAISDKHKNDFGSLVYVGIDKNIIFDLYQNKEIELLCFYLAIRSKKGRKKFVGITKIEIINRMFGAKNRDIIQQICKSNKVINGKYENINKTAKSFRCYFDKMIKKLVNRKLIKPPLFDRIINIKRIFISCTCTPEKIKELLLNKGNE
jgi:hypothetical protein